MSNRLQGHLRSSCVVHRVNTCAGKFQNLVHKTCYTHYKRKGASHGALLFRMTKGMHSNAIAVVMRDSVATVMRTSLRPEYLLHVNAEEFGFCSKARGVAT